MSPIKTTIAQLPHEARLAREKLHLEGEVPDGVLRAEIDASWRRSLSHGVHFNSKHELALESSASLDVLLSNNRLLIDAALPAIDYLAERQGKEGLIATASPASKVISTISA